MSIARSGAIPLAIAAWALCLGGCDTNSGSTGSASSHVPPATQNVATSTDYVAVTVRSPELDPRTSSRLNTIVLDDNGHEVVTVRGARGPAWFGGGRFLATIRGLMGDESVVVWDSITRNTREFACPPLEGSATPAAGSPDGTALALGVLRPPATRSGYQVVICDTTTGSQLTTIDDVLSGPIWSPDGQRIAYVTQEANSMAALKVRPVRSGASVTLAEGASIKIGRFAGRADRLVYSTLDSSAAWTALYVTDWWRPPAEPTRLWSYHGPGRAYFSPDFRYLAYDTDRGVRVRDLTTDTLSAPAVGYGAGWVDQLLVVTRQTADMDRGGTTYIAALDPASLEVAWTYP